MLELLPKDWERAILVGCIDFGAGPTPVAVRSGQLFDLSGVAPTVAQLLEKPTGMWSGVPLAISGISNSSRPGMAGIRALRFRSRPKYDREYRDIVKKWCRRRESRRADFASGFGHSLPCASR